MDDLKRLLDGLRPNALVSLGAMGGGHAVIPASTLRRLVRIEDAAVALIAAEKEPFDLNDPHHTTYWKAWEKLCEEVARG